ncbi:MAG: GNAT family N-acetyltransferase [Rhodospirillales bacterium]|nr:GNAT family N-acetyltransferase [Rhodospirillales bacterium]
MMDPGAQIIAAHQDHMERVRQIAIDAYTPYLSRMDKRPAPMDADFDEDLRCGNLFVAVDGETVAGFIVTFAREQDQFIENIAVASSAQNRGIGYRLMVFAEAQAEQNRKRFLRLYTNEKMLESLAFYLRLGYVETRRRRQQGYNRVYLEKRLSL